MPYAALKRTTALVLGLAAAVLATTSRAEITPEARGVVNRFIAATGGPVALAAIRSTHIKARASALGFSGTTEVWTRLPDRRATETVLGPFRILEGFDGTVAWRTDPGSGKPVSLDGKDLEDAMNGAYFDNERWLAPDQGGGKVILVGFETDSSGLHTVLEVTPPVGRSRRYYFNPKTGLIDRSTTKKDQLTVVSVFSDYRPVAGRRIPFRQLTQIIGMPANDLAVSVDSVWFNQEIPDSRFALPGVEEQAVHYLKTPGLARLPFGYRGRHVWVKVSVNGGEPADFIYDTGASLSVIDSAYAEKIGLKTEGRLQGQGAGATGSASFSRLQSVRVAGPDSDGVELHDQRAAVVNINAFLAPFFWQDCAGVLGYDFITRFVNEIDFDHQTLTLHDPKTYRYSGSGATIAFTLAGTVPAVRMRIDGRYKGDFRLDVGSSSTVDLHRPFVQRYHLASKARKGIQVTSGGFGGTFTNRLVRMKKIELGPYSWLRPLVSFSGAESGALASEDYAGNIGNQILERFKCILDYERRELHLEPGKKYTEPDRFSRAGVQLARFGDAVKAMQVLPRSPAYEAGMEEGDRVMSIDGKPILEYTPDDLTKLFEEGKVGRSVAFEVRRRGKRETLSIKLQKIL
jgi:hypothetical protein